MPLRERAADSPHPDGFGRLRLSLRHSAQEIAVTAKHDIGMIDDDKVGHRFRTVP